MISELFKGCCGLNEGFVRFFMVVVVFKDQDHGRTFFLISAELFKDHYHYFDFLIMANFSLGDSFSKSQSTQTFMINIKVDFLRYGCTFGDIVVLLR